MSTVLYSKGLLVADGGNIITKDDTYLFLQQPAKKIVLSTNKHVAVAKVGRICASEEVFRELADIFEDHLIFAEHLSDTSTILSEKLKEFMYRTSTFIDAIVMSSIGPSVYMVDASYDRTKPDITLDIRNVRIEDTVASGSGFMFAYTAIAAGYTPIDAIKVSIKLDTFSTEPIQSVALLDLEPFQQEIQS